MANQSIYSEKWIDLVFENRNKEYGAYQLRQENPKTTLKALAIGVLLMTFLVSIPILIKHFGASPLGTVFYCPTITPIKISSVVYPPEKNTVIKSVVPLTQKENDKPKPEVNKSNLIDPKITEAQNAKTEIASNAEPQQNYLDPTEYTNSGTDNNGVKTGTATTTERINTSELNGTHISAVLDKQPAFPGGINKFYSYVAQNFRTPEIQLSNTIKVYVSFVIEEDGTMTDIQVLRNPGFGLDKEAIRVLKNLKTKWIPGILNGKPVRTSYNLPILVKLNE